MAQNVDAIYYVTPLQHGMLHHSQREPDSGVYVEQFSCVIVGALDSKRFEEAWSEVVHRHDVLRTLFIRLDDEKPMQVVRKQVSVPYETMDWRTLGADHQETRFAELLRADRRKGFDVSKAPLVRLRLIELAPQRYRFLWTFHHAVLDGWSLPIVLDEVFRLYAGKRAGHPSSLRNAAPYRNYVSWMRAQDSTEALKFWKDFLAGHTAPLQFAPSMAPRTGAAPARRLATLEASMPKSWHDAALQTCRAHQLTLNTLCQGAWSLLLSRYCNRDDLVYGTVVSGRPSAIGGVESMVGLFICTVPCRTQIASGAALAPWLKQLQTSNFEIERYSYTGLSEILSCSAVPRTRSLFDMLYVFENYPGQAQLGQLSAACGLEVRDVKALEETNYPLALVVVPQDGLKIHLTYDTTRFGESAMQRFAEQYRHVLESLLELEGVDTGDVVSSEAPPLDVAASAQEPGRIAALLMQQAADNSRRLAFEDSTLAVSYRELARLMDRYRHEWQRSGYAPGSRVLLSVDHGLQSILVLLAGIASGVECVLPDRSEPITESLEAVRAADGSLPLAGCVADTTHADFLAQPARARAQLEITVFPSVEELLRDSAPHAIPPECDMRGACVLIARDAAGRWEVSRYGEAAILSAMLWFSRTCPADRARSIPFANAPLSHDNLWTTLFALGSGLTLQCLGVCSDDDFLDAVAARSGPWHSVRLSSAQTRSLSYRARHSATPAVCADYVVADATSLTAAARAAVRNAASQARLIEEFRWPHRSLPHALSAYDESGQFHRFTAVAPGSSLVAVDRHLRPAGVDQLGVIAVVGSTVPAINSVDSQRDERSVLATGLRAWRSDCDIHAELLSADAGLAVRDTRLADIERVLGALRSLDDVAVVERIGPRGEWERAVFYAGAGDLEAQMQARFADHGLRADAFVPVVQMPRVDRRIDRRALLRGDYEAVERDTYVAPRNDVERTLQAIWQDLLKQSRIGVKDNYFDLGGQSLLATVMLHEIDQQLSVQIEVEVLLEHPTIAGLAEAIRGGASGATRKATDLRLEVELDDAIVPSTRFDPTAFVVRNAFLTGATGFLGVHLLADLLNTTAADVHCLVRASDARSGTERLVGALKKYGLWDQRYAARLHAVPGQLEQPLLGLSEARFAALAESVDAIYHNGAQVNFVYPYSSLKQVNVLATRDILRLACHGKTKPVHYVSTVGVLDRTQDLIAEDLRVPWHAALLGGYEQSKWVAEQLVCLAADRGLPVAIYRPSRIVGHSRTGQINTDDLFCRMIKGIVELGKAPQRAGFDNIVPVDVASRVIVESSLQSLVYGRAVHVINPVWNSIDAVVDGIEREGFAVDRLDYNAWLLALEEHVKKNREHPLAMLIPVLKRLNPTVDPSISKVMPIRHANATTLLGRNALASIAHVDELLRVYFDYFYSAGYLPAQVQPVATPA